MNLPKVSEHIDKLLWGWPQIILLLVTHFFMSFKTGFIQKDIFRAIKLSLTKDPDAPGDVSQFGALTTALASTVGTANIIGVGTAIALGGPGAVLWIWFTGIFGIATKYAETIIALKYRVKSEDGTIALETKKYSGKHIDDIDESEIPVIKNSKSGVLH